METKSFVNFLQVSVFIKCTYENKKDNKHEIPFCFNVLEMLHV